MREGKECEDPQKCHIHKIMFQRTHIRMKKVKKERKMCKIGLSAAT